MHDGDLCSVESGEGGFSVVKILKLEDGIVHLRLYANRFEARPSIVVPGELELGGIDDQSFGIGHLPLDAGEFEAWQPQVIGHDPVQPAELDGYKIWREAAEEGEAGVWGAPEQKPRGRLRRWLGR